MRCRNRILPLEYQYHPNKLLVLFHFLPFLVQLPNFLDDISLHLNSFQNHFPLTLTHPDYCG